MKRPRFTVARMILSMISPLIILPLMNSARADETSSLIPKSLPSLEWHRFETADYDQPIAAMIFDLDHQPECGLALGGISTGCLDFEVSGTIGFDSIFEGYPRKLQRFTPLLGLSVGDDSWVLASPGILAGGIKPGAHDPARDPYTGPRKWKVALPWIEGVTPAQKIRYAAHYPVVDYDFETDAPVDVDLRAWSPFIPGDVAASSIPAIVLEVHLRNRTAQTQRGTLAFNYPGKQMPTETNVRWADANNKGDMLWTRGRPPLAGADPHFVRPNPPHNAGGRLVLADPSGDGRTELLVCLRDARTGRGVLVSFQRTADTWGGRMDGSGEYEWEIIDTRENDGFTVVATGDVDGDGLVEIVAGTLEGKLYLYQRRERGYQPSTTAGEQIYASRRINPKQVNAGHVAEIRLADSNGDGQDEIYYTLGYRSADARILPGLYRIDGVAAPEPLVTDAESEFLALSTGDFDADGKLELAVGSKSSKAESNRVEMLSLDDRGAVTAREVIFELPAHGGPQWLVSGDFDGNRRDDLLLGTIDHGTLWTERREGKWSRPEIASGHDFAAYSIPTAVDASDRKTYVAVGGQNSMLLGRLHGDEVAPGEGRWGLERYSLGPHQGPNDASLPAVGLGDLSGDGRLDVLTFFSGRELFGVTREDRSFFNVERPRAVGRQDAHDGQTRVVQLSHREQYAIAVLEGGAARFGGDLTGEATAWSQINRLLPNPGPADTGTSAAIDFELAPAASQTIRFVLAWYVPNWRSTFTYTRQNIIRYRDVLDVVDQLREDHASLFKRIVKWQQVVYGEALPAWLQDAMVNSLALVAEDSYWAVAQPPLGDWCFPDGLFGMIESPRAAPQVECIPCTWYGNIPILYFFPDLMRTTLRGFKQYQRGEDGAMAFKFGPRDEMWWMGDHALENQIALNGFCFVDMVHRQWLYTGDHTLIEEFYPAVKAATRFAIAARPEPHGVMHMPTFGSATEWWEGWAWEGLTTHAGSLNLAGLRMAERMAEAAGDREFAEACRQWYAHGKELLEDRMWMGSSYLLFRNIQTGRVAHDIMANQFDAEWVRFYHGLPNIFDPERFDTGLKSIRRSCIVETGAAAFATSDGKPMLRAYGNFIPEMMILGMTYIYHGDRNTGLDICRRMFENLYIGQPYAFDWPNWIYMDTGKRAYGSDYCQNMVVWAIPAALAGQTLSEVGRDGTLIDRIVKAGRPPERLRLDSGPIQSGTHPQAVPDYVPPAAGEVDENDDEIKPEKE